jgi:hypothetical protein
MNPLMNPYKVLFVKLSTAIIAKEKGSVAPQNVSCQFPIGALHCNAPTFLLLKFDILMMQTLSYLNTSFIKKIQSFTKPFNMTLSIARSARQLSSAVQQKLSVATQPLLVLVGVTGTGKSTTLNALMESDLNFTLLSDRRTLTDQFIIPTVAQWDGTPEQTFCRLERLKCTRRYRERFPGGMAHVLTQLQVAPSLTNALLIFDGLRGENEVRYAAKALPQALFVILEAGDRDRLLRLLQRNDTFDRTATATIESKTNTLTSFAALGLPEASHLFSPVEEREILTLARQGLFSATELLDKLKIVVAERRNYDPDATRHALLAIAPERTLALDTTLHSPQHIAREIVAFCQRKASAIAMEELLSC